MPTIKGQESRTNIFDPTSVRLATTDIPAYNLQTEKKVYVSNDTKDLPSGYGWNLQNSIVDSTKGLREEENLIKNESYNALQDIINYKLYDLEDPKNKHDQDLKDIANIFGMSGTEDEYAKSAGESAYAQYEPLIREAEEARRAGLPKATIRAGERGGFMSTQFAGAAALQPTQGGDFYGAGGGLEEIKSAYDIAIYNVKSKANAAKMQAEMLARESYRSGKQTEYDKMQEADSTFKDSLKELLQLAVDKANAISKYQADQQARITFDQGQEDRLKEEATNQLNYYIDNFGVDYVESNRDQIAKLFEDAGYNSADVDGIISSMKKQEQDENLPKPELRSVDGNLVFVTYQQDESGNITPKLDYLARKSSGGGGTSASEKLNKDFWSEIESGLDDLEDGRNWGTVWNRVYDKFKDSVQDTNTLSSDIDKYLDKNFWSQEGAYAKFKASGDEPDEVEEEQTAEQYAQGLISQGWSNKDIEGVFKKQYGFVPAPVKTLLKNR